MQLGIIATEPRKNDGKGGGTLIDMGLVAYPETSFDNVGQSISIGAVTIEWRDTGNDYESPVVYTKACVNADQIGEVAAILKAICHLVKKHGRKKAMGHPANLLTLVEKQFARQVVWSKDGIETVRVQRRREGEALWSAEINGEKVVTTAHNEKTAQSAINRLLVSRYKGKKDASTNAAAMADWIVAGCPVNKEPDSADGVEAVSMLVYSTASARAKHQQKKK